MSSILKYHSFSTLKTTHIINHNLQIDPQTHKSGKPPAKWPKPTTKSPKQSPP
ncbi:hypothetical protein BDV24DRAFT_122297 [Aspergillus arachidicola]|uniref:Uncharacterized protein n=1 Tax=Aspergillus arachidicola TaxID=656916 RepID=A0A5N6YNT4_9EURO|nr:hypothetical protein BDV24DRAFT_122297 [Aspergillus arachidicola]